MTMSKLLIAGAAALTLASASAMAQEVHVMTVQLPNGATQQIQYTGDVPPRVVFVPVAQPVFESPFAMIARMQADMQRQMAAMMQGMGPMMAAPGIAQVGGPVPSGVCMRSVSVTYNGSGAPQMVTRTAGDCGEAAEPAAPAVAPAAPAPNRAPKAIEVEAQHPVDQPAWAPLVKPVTALRG